MTLKQEKMAKSSQAGLGNRPINFYKGFGKIGKKRPGQKGKKLIEEEGRMVKRGVGGRESAA